MKKIFLLLLLLSSTTLFASKSEKKIDYAIPKVDLTKINAQFSLDKSLDALTKSKIENENFPVKLSCGITVQIGADEVALGTNYIVMRINYLDNFWCQGGLAAIIVQGLL